MDDVFVGGDEIWAHDADPDRTQGLIGLTTGILDDGGNFLTLFLTSLLRQA